MHRSLTALREKLTKVGARVAHQRHDHAILRALTPEAEESVGGACEIPIRTYPFRVGRETRDATGFLGLGSPERRVMLRGINNHLNLHDDGALMFISRKHFQIERDPQGGFLVKDRGSVCGTVVDKNLVGGDRRGGSCPLHDGHVIIVGGLDSPYVFQFLGAKEPESG